MTVTIRSSECNDCSRQPRPAIGKIKVFRERSRVHDAPHLVPQRRQYTNPNPRVERPLSLAVIAASAPSVPIATPTPRLHLLSHNAERGGRQCGSLHPQEVVRLTAQLAVLSNPVSLSFG
jgi:hypothetical protein